MRSQASKLYLREDLKKRRRAVADFITRYKNQPCQDCGGSFDPICMDFDHRPGELKLFNLAHAQQKTISMEKILAEIAKCDVVCSNCHRLRTHRLRDHSLTWRLDKTPSQPQ